MTMHCRCGPVWVWFKLHLQFQMSSKYQQCNISTTDSSSRVDGCVSCPWAAFMSMQLRTAASVQVVKARGEAMAAAAKKGRPHGMLSIIGLSDEQLMPICIQARESIGKDCVCQLANFLFPTGRVVSGHKDALAEVRFFLIKMQL